jgi:putative FmdB family regulatory protein
MPIYEFRCRACAVTFEAIRPMGDDGASLCCPECGQRAPEKRVSTFAAGGGCGDGGASSGFG